MFGSQKLTTLMQYDPYCGRVVMAYQTDVSTYVVHHEGF